MFSKGYVIFSSLITTLTVLVPPIFLTFRHPEPFVFYYILHIAKDFKSL